MRKTIILINLLLISLTACESTNNVFYDSLLVVEGNTDGRSLPYYPIDQQLIQVNPPGFTWPKNQKAYKYNFLLLKEEGGKKVFYKDVGLKNTVVAMKETLEPGRYSWLVTFSDSVGNVFGRTKLRTFMVDKGIPSLVMPNISELKEQVKGVKPRIFLSSTLVNSLQKRINANPSDVPFWELCRSIADSALTESLYPEPAPYKDSVFDVTEWRRIYKPVKTGTANMVRMALAWKLTKEERYLKGAKKWLLHFASWNPNGITSFRVPQSTGFEGNTEASMPLLERMGMVYDWIKDELDSNERKIVLSSIQERGNQMLKRYHDLNFISEPWDNHTVRSLAFTGLAGLATLGDLPDAEKWLDYVIQCYITSFPTWGGDDGGWSQGLSYNSTYNLYQTNFVEALSLCSDVNLYNKPFFRNNGYFGLYCNPPYATRGAFGDGGEDSHSPKDKLLLQRYANIYGDPYLLWQAENIVTNKKDGMPLLTKEYLWQGFFMEDVISVLNAKPTKVEPINPNSLDQSKIFTDIGWVAMHSDLGNAENDVWMLFKSSPFGSFSHSHADQNSFQINAFGESLLIDSGYYPYYGGPHHFLWTRQTKAHNAILVNGRGQHVQSMAAKGEIEDYKTTDGLTIVTAECPQGYNLPTSEKEIEHWKANLDDPLPRIDTETKEMRRTVVFSHDKEKPWIVVQDYIKTEDPAIFSYLLHALERIKVDGSEQRLQVKKGNAVLDIYIMSSGELQFDQTDKFDVAPDLNAAGKPNQWHFSASNVEKAKELHFLSLIVPHRVNEKPLDVKRIRYDDNINGFQIGEQSILGWLGKGEKGGFSIGSEAPVAKMIVDHKYGNEIKRTVIE
ncbi:DUF4962 domain-containing protein [Muricauda sp. ANG21]|uniref:DUF4962 domain-containing protein n=1 Tax=Allomuricauda sp. ANG21 TaxID=3042468 RepID=UPI0034513272